MSESVRVLLLLARLSENTEPTVVAAVDETIWEHWDNADEHRWRTHAKKTWGLVAETDWREVWAEFAPDDLVAVYSTPFVEGRIAGGGL